MKPCRHDPPWLPDPYQPDHGYCRICYLHATDPEYARLWTEGKAGKTGGIAVTIRRPLPCVDLGRRVGRSAGNCPRLDHHECLRGHGVVIPARECEGCPDYQPE